MPLWTIGAEPQKQTHGLEDQELNNAYSVPRKGTGTGVGTEIQQLPA